jgi:hypothetical protein
VNLVSVAGDDGTLAQDWHDDRADGGRTVARVVEVLVVLTRVGAGTRCVKQH